MHTATSRHSRGGQGMNQRRASLNSKPPRGRFYGNQTRNNRSDGANYRGGRNSRPTRKMPTFNPSQFINTNPVEATPEIYTPKYKFDTLGLNTQLVRTIASLGMTSPTPIQDQIIPEIIAKRDVIGIAETGTGKTAAFLIPLIENTLKEQNRQTLILAPTRELALQIEKELRGLSLGLRIFSAICIGGISVRPQIKALLRRNHFVIGTPGRILDLINRRHFIPTGISTVVLDEADRMLDMGFVHDMKKILSATPKNRETLLFSATMSKGTEQIVHNFLRNPVKVSVKKKDVANNIAQDVVSYEHHSKFETLTALLSKPEFKRVLIFGAMKHGVKKLAQELSARNVRAESIHGNKSHEQRQKALEKFKSGNTRVLVATDVAARGIHIEDVTHVINYDLPNTFEDYVHRIGRTGRGTKHGKALTFVLA